MNKVRLMLLALLICGLILSVVSPVTLAVDPIDSDPIDVTATINAKFGFTIRDTSPITITADPGTEALGSHDIAIDAWANTGATWMLKLTGGPLTHTDTTTQIDNSNFLFWHTVNVNAADPNSPHGTLSPAFGTTAAMAELGQVIYTSSADEGVDDFVGLGVGVKITVPLAQKAGDYNTTLTVTMTE